MEWKRKGINGLIEEAILEADAKGVKVLSLGLLNQVLKHTFSSKITIYTY